MQEFDLEIKDKQGANNVVADNLSWLVSEECSIPLRDHFLNEQILAMADSTPWYANIVNYLVTKKLPTNMPQSHKLKIKKHSKKYVWDEPYLRHFCEDQTMRRCVPEIEHASILNFVIHMHVVDILEVKELPLKCWKVVFIGPHCLKMHILYVKHVIDVNV